MTHAKVTVKEFANMVLDWLTGDVVSDERKRNTNQITANSLVSGQDQLSSSSDDESLGDSSGEDVDGFGVSIPLGTLAARSTVRKNKTA